MKKMKKTNKNINTDIREIIEDIIENSLDKVNPNKLNSNVNLNLKSESTLKKEETPFQPYIYIETQFHYFQKLIFDEDRLDFKKNLLKSFEYARIINICKLLIRFCKDVLKHKLILNDLRERIRLYLFHKYNKTVYFRTFRRFKFTLINHNIQLRSYMNPSIIELVNKFFDTLQKRLDLLQNMFLDRTDLIQIIDKDSLDNFIFKIIFLMTILIDIL
jgi:hypothetical protein